jgi:hypothetical protein
MVITSQKYLTDVVRDRKLRNEKEDANFRRRKGAHEADILRVR